ncbi:hypothetical protein SAMN05216338_1002134 [Bradyrhizobium sp. Rc2d]|nr:hypothetical protein SAMN05216338_1002134 [Bradyrhizobium sp. Rc2d]
MMGMLWIVLREAVCWCAAQDTPTFVRAYVLERWRAVFGT